MEAGKGKYLFGVCKVGEKGQIVIPKEARDIFAIQPGDSLVLLGDLKKGLAIVKADVFTAAAEGLLGIDSREPAAASTEKPHTTEEESV